MSNATPPVDFVGIGAPRAGTTYLDALLRTHSELHLPTDRKEVHYFDQHYDRGTDWYRELVRRHATAAQKCGEITPAYLFGEDIPEKLAKVSPDAKLLLCVRDPVERAFSHYQRICVLKGEKRPFLTLLETGSPVLEASRYAHHVENWLRHFHTSQLLVVKPESLKLQSCLSTIAVHLEIDEDGFSPPSEKMNVAANSRSKFFLAAKAIGRFAHRHNINSILKLRLMVSKRIRTQKPKSDVVQRLDSATYNAAAEHFRNDSRRLRELVGFNAEEAWPELYK